MRYPAESWPVDDFFQLVSLMNWPQLQQLDHLITDRLLFIKLPRVCSSIVDLYHLTTGLSLFFYSKLYAVKCVKKKFANPWNRFLLLYIFPTFLDTFPTCKIALYVFEVFISYLAQIFVLRRIRIFTNYTIESIDCSLFYCFKFQIKETLITVSEIRESTKINKDDFAVLRYHVLQNLHSSLTYVWRWQYKEVTVSFYNSKLIYRKKGKTAAMHANADWPVSLVHCS